MPHNDRNGKVSVFYLEYLKIMTDEHTDRHSKYTVATKNKIRNYELYNIQQVKWSKDLKIISFCLGGGGDSQIRGDLYTFLLRRGRRCRSNIKDV